MSWSVEYSPSAARDLRRVDRTDAARVVAALRRLAETGQGDVRRLTAAHEWRLRVGDIRVLFRFDYETETLTVRRILPHGRAYR